MRAGHRSRWRLARVADALGASARGGVNDNYLDNFDRDSLRAQESKRVDMYLTSSPSVHDEASPPYVHEGVGMVEVSWQ